MNRLLAILAFALFAHATPALAQSCTAVTAVPATISASGKYCLARDFTINSTSAKAITINANDVTLDCDGHTLKNLATADNGSSAGIYFSSRNGIVIRNCRILGGFTSGIIANQANTQPNRTYYVNIEHNYIAGPFFYGILAYGSALEISGNRIYDIGGQANSDAFGIRVGGTTAGGPRFHLVQDNLVAGTTSPTRSAYGIYSDNSLASIFIKNGVTASAGNASFGGFGLRIGGFYNRISDNHVVGAGNANDVGIYSDDGTTSCYDNYIRAQLGTTNCDATLGNY
jgi:hypothetical protein